MSTDLRQQLHAAIPAEDVATPRPDAVWGRGRRLRRRRRAATAVGALVGLGALVAGGLTVAGDAAVVPYVGSAPATEGWSSLPDAPLAPRHDHGAAWTGSELVVWGGTNRDGEHFADGAAYDPRTGSWRELPPAPLEGRARPVTVWTGHELLVLGGVTVNEQRAAPRRAGGADPTSSDQDGAGGVGPDAGETHHTDGAVYDPQADRWRPMAQFPHPLEGRSLAATAWTGEELVVWGGVTSLFSGPRRALDNGAVYDADTDSWRVPANAPLAPRAGATAVWTGQRVLVWGGTAEQPSDGRTPPDPLALTDGAAYDPAADRWEAIADGPEGAGRPNLDSHAAAWTGERMLVWQGDGAAAYDPVTDTWETLPGWPEAGHQVAPQAVWTGAELVAWGGWLEEPGAPGGPTDRGYAFAPARGAWRELPDAPLGPRSGHTLTAGDGAVFVWGGTAPQGAPASWFGDRSADLADGAVYHPGVP